MVSDLYRFGPFCMDVESRTLLRDGEILPLPPRAFDVLQFLVMNTGRVVSKKELIDAVWGDTAVLESNLAHQVKMLRDKLGTDADGQPLIRTAARQGYYLAVQVTRGQAEQLPVLAEVVPEVTTGTAPSTRYRRTVRPWALAVLMGGMATVLLAMRLLPSGVFGPSIKPFPQIGRLLPRSTSEGWRPRQISMPLNQPPTYLAISSRGDKVFAADGRERTLSILSTANDTFRTLVLPRYAGALAISPDGKLYIGSFSGGIMVVDVETGQLLPDYIETGGPVYDIAITPDGTKLFMAMSTKGLKRLSTGSRKLAQVSDRICPERLAMDRQGARLYVSYQCSGPEGESGHDSVEIFDAEKEVSLGVVSGPPMVGGPISISPDGDLALLDGSDACYAPKYDHQGCKSAPSHVFHLLRTSDNRILHTFEFPAGPLRAQFLDNSRILLIGDSISVVDAARYSVLERWNGAADCRPQSVAFAPDGRRAYLGCERSDAMLVLEPEKAECSPSDQGLDMFYPGDGSTEDAAGITELTPHGNVRFMPGRVGRAFFLDGSSYLTTPKDGHYEYGFHDLTVALYAKFAATRGEMAMVDWTAEKPRRGIRLFKSGADRILFQSWPDASPLESTTSVRPDVWYHVAVTRSDRELALYVNGKLESHGAPPPLDHQLEQPIFIGAHAGAPAFQGWFDEIAFYNRALTAKEVEEMFQLRESGACKL